MPAVKGKEVKPAFRANVMKRRVAGGGASQVVRAGASARSSAGRNGALGTNEGGGAVGESGRREQAAGMMGDWQTKREREREGGRYLFFFSPQSFGEKSKKKGNANS